MAPRDAFEGYDDPINIDMEPEDALRLLLGGAQPEEETEEADGE